MYTKADKTAVNKSQAVANTPVQMQAEQQGSDLFSDNRAESVVQRKLQEAINSSPRVQQLKSYQAMADNFAAGKAIQKQAIEEELGQEKFAPLQKKEANNAVSVASGTPEQEHPNNTGLPDSLKAGVENLSGYSMDDVKVHYNSAQPAQLQAHAYAQGTDIHIAPGQEQHLPHEAWHVVQQKQGRVQSTMKDKNNVPVNNDAGLENEATTMGARSASLSASKPPAQLIKSTATQKVAQLVGGDKVGYNPKDIESEGEGFKTAVKSLFDVARNVNKIRKKIATKANIKALSTLDASKKGSQVKNVYALDLSAINLDAPWLQKVITDKPFVADVLKEAKEETIIAESEINPLKQKIEDTDKKVEVKPSEEKILDKTWVEKEGETRPEAKILSGSALFVKKTEKDVASGVFRDIYKKLGKEDGENNEYVLDDFDKHTHRYAYMEKSYYQWMAFKEKGFLTGKKQDLAAAATGGSAKDIDPTEFEKLGLKRDEETIFNSMPDKSLESRKIALALMHQWKGSGPGQRGLSLTATAKDEAVYGNTGESFKTDEGAKFKIDLAKTNPADNILINHYAHGSKTREALTPGAEANGLLGTRYQYERSVIKNRELYLRNLAPDAVVSIVPNSSTMDVARDSALYNKGKQDSINHGSAQRSLNDWTEYKKTQQAKLTNETQDKAASERAKSEATTNEKNAVAKKKSYRGDYRTYQFPGYKNPVSYFIFWQNNEKYYAKQITDLAEKISQLTVSIATTRKQLEKCDEQIAIFRSRLLAKPASTELHASRGWQSGEDYTKGYNEGLKAIRGITHTSKSAIDKIFDEAYADASKKAEAQKTGTKFTEKFTPYWEGFGAALKKAIK